MPKFSQSSLTKLEGVHRDLQVICFHAIQKIDFTVVYGWRSMETQVALWNRGRELHGHHWVIVDKKKVVTYKNGISDKSKHQLRLAIDIVPYHNEYPHIRWDDTKSIYFLAGYIMALAEKLKQSGDIDSSIRYGGDWNRNYILDDETFLDTVHFEII